MDSFQQPLQSPPLHSSTSLLPSPPLVNPLGPTRARLKRTYSTEPPHQSSTLVSIEESPWGEAVADAFSRPAGNGHSRGASWGANGGLGVRVELNSGERDRKRFRPDITPHLASLSLQADAQPYVDRHPHQAALSQEEPRLVGLPSQPPLAPPPTASVQLQPAQQQSTAPVTPPLQQGTAHLMPGFSSAAGMGPGAAPTPSPPPPTMSYSVPPAQETRMDDSSPPSSVPTSPQFRPKLDVRPLSPSAPMRALPPAVERLRSPVLGSPNAGTEGRRLRRTARSSLGADQDEDAPMVPVGASSFNISPHRVYVASLEDSDDESSTPLRPPTVIGLKRTASTRRHLPPSPLPDSLITPTTLPPGTGELILYRPLTFGKQKEEEGRQGEQWDEYLRERQSVEVEGDVERGRREMSRDGVMDDDEEAAAEGNSEEGMDLDG